MPVGQVPADKAPTGTGKTAQDTDSGGDVAPETPQPTQKLPQPTQGPASADKTEGGTVPVEKTKKKKAQTAEDKTSAAQAYAKILASGVYDSFKEGEGGLAKDSKQKYVIGSTISVDLVARVDGSLCMGGINVTPKQKLQGGWVVVIHAGATLYDVNGQAYFVTKRTEVTITESSPMTHGTLPITTGQIVNGGVINQRAACRVGRDVTPRYQS